MQRSYLEIVMPFPRPETVPPVTTMYFICGVSAMISPFANKDGPFWVLKGRWAENAVPLLARAWFARAPIAQARVTPCGKISSPHEEITKKCQPFTLNKVACGVGGITFGKKNVASARRRQRFKKKKVKFKMRGETAVPAYQYRIF